LLVAKAGCAAAANIRVAASIDEAAASTTFFVNILVPAPVKVVFKRARLFQNARLIKRGSKSPVVGQFEFNQSLSAAYARNAPKTPMIMR
jgi:hypothetical protein